MQQVKRVWDMPHEVVDGGRLSLLVDPCQEFDLCISFHERPRLLLLSLPVIQPTRKSAKFAEKNNH